MVDDAEFMKRRHLSRGRPRKYEPSSSQQSGDQAPRDGALGRGQKAGDSADGQPNRSSADAVLPLPPVTGSAVASAGGGPAQFKLAGQQ